MLGGLNHRVHDHIKARKYLLLVVCFGNEDAQWWGFGCWKLTLVCTNFTANHLHEYFKEKEQNNLFIRFLRVLSHPCGIED